MTNDKQREMQTGMEIRIERKERSKRTRKSEVKGRGAKNNKGTGEEQIDVLGDF